MSKKLPYGISNFADLIESNYAYVDKTRFIELLENENNCYQFLLRPRRFGKSLFLSVLENYYDMNKKHNFQNLFKDLYIGKNPTKEQGKYAILYFNFSAINTENEEEFKNSFKLRILNSAITFYGKYKDRFKIISNELNQFRDSGPGINSLDVIYRLAELNNIPIFTIIDEYDHFSNDLVAMGSEFYGKMVGRAGLVRDFYESLKIATSTVMKRIFITGVTPIMLNDLTSGFNIATDYSLFPKYNELFGFTKKEVEYLIQETGIDKNLIEVDMEAYYNGYLFHKNAENKVYNSTMVLFLFNQISQLGKQPEQVIDTNLQTDLNRLKKLAKNKANREALLKIANEGSVSGNIVEKFSLDKIESEEHFISLLFYLGMLTIGGTHRGMPLLKIPNYSIKTLYFEYIVHYVKNLEKEQFSDSELSRVIAQMAFDGEIKPYLDFFAENFLKRLSNRDLINFDEKYIKVMMLASLFMSRLYLPVSESENINGYTDIYLPRHYAIPDIKYEYVLEVKYAKTDASEIEVKTLLSQAEEQIEKYKKDPRFADREDIKFATIVFKGKGEYICKDSL